MNSNVITFKLLSLRVVILHPQQDGDRQTDRQADASVLQGTVNKST